MPALRRDDPLATDTPLSLLNKASAGLINYEIYTCISLDTGSGGFYWVDRGDMSTTESWKSYYEI